MTTKGIKNLSRKTETREQVTRKRGWVPPSNLDAPERPEGYHHRWVRSEYRGQQDEKNFIGRLRSGYELVRADEYPDRMDLPAIADGKYKGVIGTGGLILMRCPIEVKEDRDEYFRGLTNDKTTAIEKDLHKAEHPALPIHQDRQSRVTFGGKKS